jgi:hypothetical protein
VENAKPGTEMKARNELKVDWLISFLEFCSLLYLLDGSWLRRNFTVTNGRLTSHEMCTEYINAVLGNEQNETEK